MLTPIQSAQQILSGALPPGASLLPDNPQQPALYVQLDAITWLGMFAWDVGFQSWVAMPATEQNFGLIESFGWAGKHNDTRRQANPAHTAVNVPCVYFPYFSVQGESPDPIPFEIVDALGQQTLATGVFPAGVTSADAVACSLIDVASNPITSFTVAAGAIYHFAAVPVGGHAAAPATGYGFSVSGLLFF